jgi:hypothetical protein
MGLASITESISGSAASHVPDIEAERGGSHRRTGFESVARVLLADSRSLCRERPLSALTPSVGDAYA